jgi:signal transduction histidine kinase
MKEMRKTGMIKALCLLGVFFLCAPAFGGEQASVEEVYDMVLKAANVVEQLGDEALKEFNNPKGEFVWKDTYVWVLDCSVPTNAAHPFRPDLVGKDLTELKCKKTGKLFFQEFCKIGKNPNGGWVEYWWAKAGQPKDQLFRKITFVIQVPGSKYQVAAGIYNDSVTIKELNETAK